MCVTKLILSARGIFEVRLHLFFILAITTLRPADCPPAHTGREGQERAEKNPGRGSLFSLSLQPSSEWASPDTISLWDCSSLLTVSSTEGCGCQIRKRNGAPGKLCPHSSFHSWCSRPQSILPSVCVNNISLFLFPEPLLCARTSPDCSIKYSILYSCVVLMLPKFGVYWCQVKSQSRGLG